MFYSTILSWEEIMDIINFLHFIAKKHSNIFYVAY